MTAPNGTTPAASRRDTSPPYLERGSRGYWRRASVALLFAGYATFSRRYYVQPLLPEFSRTFGVSPVQSSLTLPFSTAAVAVAVFVAGFVSKGVSRHRPMTASLLLSSLLTRVAAFAPHRHQRLVPRALTGLALGGVPAIGMVHLAEAVRPDGLGLAMGRYVGGNAIGGMAGRAAPACRRQLLRWITALRYL